MKKYHSLDELVATLLQHQPEADFGFLSHSIYVATLTRQRQQDFLWLIEWVRSQHLQDASFESVYYRLLHLYVLNENRFDSLRLIDRRLRGLADGQNALLLISGGAVIGKTSLVLDSQERMHTLCLPLIMVRCSEEGNATYGLWQRVVRSASVHRISIDDLPAPLGIGVNSIPHNLSRYWLHV